MAFLKKVVGAANKISSLAGGEKLVDYASSKIAKKMVSPRDAKYVDDRTPGWRAAVSAGEVGLTLASVAGLGSLAQSGVKALAARSASKKALGHVASSIVKAPTQAAAKATFSGLTKNPTKLAHKAIVDRVAAKVAAKVAARKAALIKKGAAEIYKKAHPGLSRRIPAAIEKAFKGANHLLSKLPKPPLPSQGLRSMNFNRTFMGHKILPGIKSGLPEYLKFGGKAAKAVAQATPGTKAGLLSRVGSGVSGALKSAGKGVGSLAKKLTLRKAAAQAAQGLKTVQW